MEYFRTAAVDTMMYGMDYMYYMYFAFYTNQGKCLTQQNILGLIQSKNHVLPV